MKSFYLITNESKDPDLIKTVQIEKIITDLGGVITGKVIQSEMTDIVPDKTDCIVVLGGDGTILRTARNLYGLGIPFLGINIGHLGYLTEGSQSGAADVFSKVIGDEYIIEDRMLISGKMRKKDGSVGEKIVSLNDIVLGRSGFMQLINFNLYVNGELLYNYSADGIIVSTPTGSTAYNLSCGGPVVEPTAGLFLITPIAPHSLNNRSLVLPKEDIIEIEVKRSPDAPQKAAYAAYFDGDAALEVLPEDRIIIASEQQVVKLVRLSSRSFLETLKVKMS